ncbi:hypothetical protein D9757_000803 [Collybiopsis confluens]|uniref:SHSP domain-containing protein n=1 Tax=Collybiopsis confluens TaxID=2823264 RepID=A0A8H5MGC9_9AGAR|nr:hypothetical protein D9757_000803 [Collybiopsis confluens]
MLFKTSHSKPSFHRVFHPESAQRSSGGTNVPFLEIKFAEYIKTPLQHTTGFFHSPTSMSPTSTSKVESSRDHDASHHHRPLGNTALEAAVHRRIKQLIKADKLRLVNPSTGKYRPRLDLYDDPTLELVTATIEIPGIKREDLTLNIDAGFLVVRGQRNRPRLRHLDERSLPSNPSAYADIVAAGDTDADDQDARPQYRVLELRYGDFERRIPLPPGTQVSVPLI